MCILFIAIQQHPQYPLIIAANRDEFFARPSRSAHFWDDASDIFAGRDMQAGGTWLGINKAGQIAALTNLRMPESIRTDARSRGELVARYLRNDDSAEQYRDFVANEHSAFNPFNLLFGDGRQLFVFSSLAPGFKRLEAGFHSISNGMPDDYWPKMSRGVNLLEQCILQPGELNIEQLAAVMQDKTQADDDSLPATGISQADEKHLSSIFISGAEYGTRTTSLLLCEPGRKQLIEYNYEAHGVLTDKQSFVL
ncbi:MAG: NRDE family protein [Pseudomonadales bacterium]